MIEPAPQSPHRIQRIERIASPSPHMTWIVYILECAGGSLYTGITNDLARRLRAHASGRGAKYTKRRGPFTVRYTERLTARVPPYSVKPRSNHWIERQNTRCWQPLRSQSSRTGSIVPNHLISF